MRLTNFSQLVICLPAWNIVHAGALRAAFFTCGLKLLALNKYFIVVVVVVGGGLKVLSLVDWKSSK